MKQSKAAKEKRRKFLDMLQELDISMRDKFKLVEAFFETDEATWKDGFDRANFVNDKYRK